MRCAFAATGFATLVLACAPTKTDGTSPLVLQAYGGPSGQVSVDVFEGGGQKCGSPVTAGACQFTSCQVAEGVGSPGFGGGNFGPMSASVGWSTVAVTYDGRGYPTVYFPSWVSLGTGGEMTFQGQGGTTDPSFDVTAIIPGVGVLTAPVATPPAVIPSIATTQDLTVTWTPISIGEIQFQLDVSDADGGVAISIACAFDGSSGSGVVSQSLLSSLKAMVPTPTSSYGILYAELDTTTVIDGLEIITQSFQTGSSGTFGEFDVSFQ
jgi:hypothetical protein